MERLALALEAARSAADSIPEAVILAMGNAVLAQANKLASDLRLRGIRTDLLSPERGLKALMRRADKLKAHYALILGQNESARGVIQLRDLRESTQQEVAFDQVAERIAANVGSRSFSGESR